MYYVGIDIAKQLHFAPILSEQGEVITPPFEFSNDYDGLSRLLASLSKFEKDNLIIGLESTAHYALNVIACLIQNNYHVCLINPIQTASLRKNNIRKTKTDKVDTALIAKALQWGSHKRLSQTDLDMLSIKSITRFRRSLVKSKTSLKIKLTSYVDQIFPELQYFFKSGLHINTCYALLKEVQDPRLIASLHLTHLTHLLKSASRGRFDKQKAIEL